MQEMLIEASGVASLRSLHTLSGDVTTLELDMPGNDNAVEVQTTSTLSTFDWKTASKIADLVKHGEMFNQVSQETGGYVRLQEEYGMCPALIDADGQPVFIYELVEAIDGAIDYDDIKGEFPSLSYAQISGAIMFLRKLASFNVKGLDIDHIENYADSDPAFIETLRQAFADKEPKRVLYSD